MKVTITPTDEPGPPVQLAGEGPESVSEFRCRTTQTNEIAQFFRADDATPLPRGNRVTELTWKTTRQHASPADAASFCISHAPSIPEMGILTLEAIATSGGTGRRTYPNALPAIVECTFEGATSYTSYSFVAPSPTALSANPANT